ncbi:MAG: ATP-binding protein [bacterium]
MSLPALATCADDGPVPVEPSDSPSSAAPAARLGAAIAVCLFLAAVCAIVATSAPWLGLRLAPADSARIVVVNRVHRVGAAASTVREGEQLLRVSSAGGVVALVGSDLLEEPDLLDTWPEMTTFYARQSALTRVLASGPVTLTLRDADARERDVVITPHARPLSSLPFVFWMQLAFGMTGCLIGVWVWSLRPTDWATRMYAATGAMFVVFTYTAAIYSARELALPGGLFGALDLVNHLGATLFGAALCGIFLTYPEPIVRPRVLGALFGLAFIWWLLDVTRVAPDQNWASRLPVMIEMAGAIVLAGVQWRRAKGDPAARSVLRWFALCVLVGCGLFVTLNVVTAYSGVIPVLPQGYAFGFFTLMYAGLAVGLRRHRLFDLDEWALRILLWGFAAVLLVAFDLIALARLGRTRSLGLTLLLALAYLPLRQWLWDRLLRRERIAPELLFDEALLVGFAGSDVERTTRWRALLERVFEPLHVTVEATHVSRVTLCDDGLVLTVPAVASSQALRLSHPWGGRRLFATRHVRLAETLVRLMRSADEGRDAFAQGVLRERSRIARDLHDDVSSPLLAGLGTASNDQVRADIRSALTQMRSIVTGTATMPMSLDDCIADIRFDAVKRLSEHRIAVDWPLPAFRNVMLDGAQARDLAMLHQETVTNIIKHAGASRVIVRISVHHDRIRSRIADDGIGFARTQVRRGQGLANLEARATTLGGTVAIGSDANGRGTVVELDVPVALTTLIG